MSSSSCARVLAVAVAAFPLTVALQPDHLELKPGGTAGVTVAITNVSDIVEHYQVTLVGLPSDDYWTAEPAVTKLRPGETARIDLRISLPERGGVLGGRYPLGVLVTSTYQEDVSRSVDLPLDVGAVSGITLSATPVTVTGKTAAVYSLSLTNDGNIDVPVELKAVDDQGRADITITPPTLFISPGSTQVAQVSVKAPSLLTGQERRSTVSVTAVARGETRGEARVGFIQTPLVAPGVVRALGVLMAVGVVAAAILVGSILGRQADPPSPVTPAQSSASGGGGGASTPPPSPSTSSAPPPAKPTVSSIEADPAVVLTGTETTFKAEASDSATTWSWQVVDSGGTVVTTDPSPKEFRFTFPTPGDFLVKLSVADGSGQSVAAADLPVTVTEQPPDLVVVRHPVTVPPMQAATQAAACPEDLVALSGGVDVTSTPVGTVVQSSHGTGDDGTLTQWTVTLLNRTADPADVTITAVCAVEPAGYDVVETSDTSVEPGTTTETTPTCKDGRVALGGGGGILSGTEVDTNSLLEESTPVQDDTGSWTGWRVRARNNASSPQSLTAQLVCAQEPDGYEVVPDQQTIASGTAVERTLAPVCDSGADTIGGGVGVSDELAPGNDLVLRSTGIPVPTEGSGPQPWTSVLSFTGDADQPVTAWAVCAQL